jgi:hypothetical protein
VEEDEMGGACSTNWGEEEPHILIEEAQRERGRRLIEEAQRERDH